MSINKLILINPFYSTYKKLFLNFVLMILNENSGLRNLQNSLKLFSQLVTLIKEHQEESLSSIKEDKHYSDKKLRK